jgi:DNA-binding transcriptional regulator YiaG
LRLSRATNVKKQKQALRRLEKNVADKKKRARKPRGQRAAKTVELTASKDKVEKARFSPELIKKLRRRKGLTQTQMAAVVGVNASTVNFWERGRSQPRGENFEALVALRDASKADIKTLLAQRAPELGPPGPANKPRGRGRPRKKR